MKEKENEVRAFIKKFCKKTHFDFEKGLKVINIRNKFFIADKNLISLTKRIGIKPAALGVFLGEVRKNDFYPSSALLDLISKKSNKKVFLNKKSAWLFLCGRDVFGSGIIKAEEKNKGELVLVQNENDENLGYGKIISNLTEENKVVIKNCYDRGIFIRKRK